MPIPIFWIEFRQTHGRAPRAEELSSKQLAKTEECFRQTIVETSRRIQRWEEGLQEAEGTFLETPVREHLDQELRVLAQMQILLQELRGEPFPNIFDLVKDLDGPFPDIFDLAKKP